MSTEREVQYTIRVKIPEMDMNNLSRCSRHRENCQQAIFEQKPSGFEVDWESARSWPVDSEGYTWVKLYCVDSRLAIEFWMRKVDSYKAQLLKVKEAVNNIEIGV